MFFTAHDLIILDKVSYEKLSVYMFPYSSVIHPLSCKRTWPFSQLHSKTTLSREKMPFEVQKPITSVRQNVFSHLCAFPLICSFKQYCSIFHPPWIYSGFLPLLSLSPLWFFAFSFLSSMSFIPSYPYR